MIAIVDYGMGNVRSVYNALDYLGEDAVITADPKQLDKATHLILPGVGAFGDAMESLTKLDLPELLAEQVLRKGKPLLGICLGMQLLAKSSEEHGLHQGLGWLDSEVVQFKFQETGLEKLKIPHMGWNELTPQYAHPLFAKLKPGEFTFYFVHSLHMVCQKQENIAAVCDYGYSFTAAVCQDNIFATQFHPEKSQDNGIQLLENFVRWRP